MAKKASGAELGIVLLLALLQIWTFPRYYGIAGVALSIMIAGWVARKQGLQQLGLLDIRFVLPVAGIVVGIAIGKVVGIPDGGWKKVLLVLVAYFGWAVLQQVFLNAFVANRLHDVGVPQSRIPLLAGIVFAAMHIPNPLLMPVTFVGGLLASHAFLRMRRKNIYALALAHALTGTAILYLLPDSWHHRLEVGSQFLQ